MLLVDIDEEHFETTELFELAAAKTLSNFKEILGSQPTQLWTGGGYHFIMPQSVPVLENIDKFSKIDQPSRRYMQFEEQLLTNGKGDQSHWSTVSFNNCMLRVPGSLNSHCIDDGVIPPEAKVKIVKHWDGNMPDVKKVLLMQYYNYLQFTAIRDIHKHKQKDRRVYGRARSCSNIHGYGYGYIERLINKPINKHRNYCVWRILVPYYINIKGLSRSQTFDLVKTWLDKCNSVARLDFDF